MNARPWWVLSAQLTGLGWYIATAIVAPTLIGVWLDGKTGTAPLFLLVGLMLGVLVAFYGTYRMAVTFLVAQHDSREQKGLRD